MAPSTANETLARRQSCDRCHGQKLRCTRTGNNNNTGACDRCIRRRAQCVYSASLPKGRPSMNRLPPPASASTSMSSCATSWPWLENLDWSDVAQTDGSRPDLSQPIITPETDSSPEFTESLPTLTSWMSSSGTGHSAGDTTSSGQGMPPSPTLTTGLDGSGSDPFEGSSGNSSSIATPMLDRSSSNNHDVGIAQLLQLTTRLSLLHRSSCNLAEKCQSREPIQTPTSRLIIDDDAFKCVTTWLSHTPTHTTPGHGHGHDQSQNSSPGSGPPSEANRGGDILYATLSASQQLLDSLRCLQASTSHSPGGGLDPCNTFAVMRHLVMACHTLLLNIYVAVLTALQHDADLRARSSLPTSIHTNINAHSPHPDEPALADIQLVMLVQLCSYLIGRQHQAVDSYLTASQISTPSSQLPNHHLSDSHHPRAMSDLETEVQRRLTHLRQTLCI